VVVDVVDQHDPRQTSHRPASRVPGPRARVLLPHRRVRVRPCGPATRTPGCVQGPPFQGSPSGSSSARAASRSGKSAQIQRRGAAGSPRSAGLQSPARCSYALAGTGPRLGCNRIGG
jgi:hypothetical protein